MAQDLMYYYDKNTKIEYELGEIQSDFNMSMVLDGTKDSMQVQVYNYNEVEVEANTIVWHKATDTWWVVKKDIVKRFANEVGAYYLHNLTLLGAIDLLNNRDLIDCGFNANNYTIEQVVNRIIKLSTFEFHWELAHTSSINKDKKVDYVKSYENFTPLSALRDFLGGYNSDIKLHFRIATIYPSGERKIITAIFSIIPKSGNVSLTQIDISHFEDIREQKTMDKESYGATVISNAQNVISTQAKTFPLVGGVRLTGSDYETAIQNAYIKLPSNAWYVNWVKAMCPQYLYLGSTESASLISHPMIARSSERYFLFDDKDCEKAIDDLIRQIRAIEVDSNISQADKDFWISKINQSREEIKKLCKSATITFYNNAKYNPRVNTPSGSSNGTIVKEDNVPYVPILDNALSSIGTSTHKANQVALMDKESSNLLRNSRMAITWERGSNKIEGFRTFDTDGVYLQTHWNQTDLLTYGTNMVVLRHPQTWSTEYVTMGYDYNPTHSTFDIVHIAKGITWFQINYIPMTDLKVKQDNQNNNLDTKLYNQNGKLNDSVGLSKLIDSYSKEIESDTITRYMQYNKYSDIPKIGTIVNNNGVKYVINNISYDFYPNESSTDNVNYYIECEFTLSRYVSTKSIMTSPNTNIRDYGIPQKYNIKRRQVYRDYYEFGFSWDTGANTTTPYTKISKYITTNNYPSETTFDHTALIKIEYDNLVDNQQYWYYQLNSTIYIMNKAIYEVIDFDDNNIIGYDIQNSTTGFNMSDLWSNQYRAVTTPVSYVDDNGKFKGITLQMTNSDTLSKAYEDAEATQQSVMLSAHVFINDTIYDYVASPSGARDSDIVYRDTEYSVTLQQPIYSFIMNIPASEFGIPDSVEINSTNITGLVNVSVKNNEVEMDANDYSLAIVFPQTITDRTIPVWFTVTNPRAKFGSSTGRLKFNFGVSYLSTSSLADYIIDEPLYEKDAIEVPVFEYSMQVGDTSEVEVGENILNNKSGYLTMYRYVIRDKNTLTPLNADANFYNLTASGEEIVNDDFDFQYNLSATNCVTIAYSGDKKTMIIKFGSGQEAVFYGDTDQTGFALQSLNVHDAESELKTIGQYANKDIMIYKTTIKGMHYDTTTQETSVEIENDLMFIIHNGSVEEPSAKQLEIKINHYKLD